MNFISSQEAAKLLDVAERAIRMAAQSGKYEYRYIPGVGRGGKRLQIELESLPEEAQKRYWETLDAARQAEYFEFMSRTTKNQRNNADRKARIVEDYNRSGLSYQKYVTAYNADRDRKEWISKASLIRWYKAYDPENPESLIDWHGTFERENPISPAAWSYFYDLYMTQQRRSIQLCYDLTKDAFSDTPSYYAFYRRVKQIPQPALIYYRYGKKAYEDKCLPSMERNKDIPSKFMQFFGFTEKFSFLHIHSV